MYYVNIPLCTLHCLPHISYNFWYDIKCYLLVEKFFMLLPFWLENAWGVGIEWWPWSPDLVSCVGLVCCSSLSLLPVYYALIRVVKNSFLVTPGGGRVCLSSKTLSTNQKKGFNLVFVFQCILLSLHSQSCQNNGQQSVTSRTPYFRYHQEFLFLFFFKIIFFSFFFLNHSECMLK